MSDTPSFVSSHSHASIDRSIDQPVTELLASLILHTIPKCGVALYWQLVDKFGSAAQVLQQDPDCLVPLFDEEIHADLRAFLHEPRQHQWMRRAQGILAWCEQHHTALLSFDDERYPTLLRHIARPPALLYVQGDANLLNAHQIAIVGSRKPTRSGENNATRFAAELAQRGYCITSGLALGVDGAAHRGALQANGKTIAVMGTGIDQRYPKRHVKLAEEIIACGGALVSEFPLQTKATPQNFPQRNRIVSGMSLGTLVVEAAVKSGSLISAKFALEQNREVFAIPGALQNPLSRGCHALIKQGAVLTETVDDIVEQLPTLPKLEPSALVDNDAIAASPNAALDALSENEKRLLMAIDYVPSNIDELADATQMEVASLMGLLMMLELKGLVHQSGEGFYRA